YDALLVNAMKRRPLRTSLTTVTALSVILIAILAGGCLCILQRMYKQSAHTQATRHVLSEGGVIATHLADQAVVRDHRAGDDDWTAFSRQIRALHTIEDGLQYVSVTRDGMTVFHEQTRGLELASAPKRHRLAEPPDDIDVTRKLVDLAGERVPVVVFKKVFQLPDGATCEVEVAMRKDTVDREGRAAASAVAAMFKLSLVTVSVSFGVCVILVIWMMRRELQREKQRREEEHLAYAGVLANGIVHDFRNPMSAVRLDVQMLKKEVERGREGRPERLSELASRIQETVDRMDKVFKEFLYMSKPPSDEREPIDVAVCVRECASLLTSRMEKAEVTVELDLPSQPVFVLAYPSALQRALMNVVINAEQVSRKGDKLQLRVVRGDRTATIDVVDTGPGVKPVDRQRIFEMFVTSRPGGTGLGLFLAKTAIERCGGTIRILDSSDKGSCFRITLPLATGASA
ncbi:MAG: HAMP domain-containing sensor histidine kinase, partial [Verrucomicrobia bacterium]|nr:HAMP domain-containing sensor histidine kinase [Verrucomicrobiota bacterium]